MSFFVWCKNEECRIPGFRCLLCREDCYSLRYGSGQADGSLEILVKSGKLRERFVMKRKGNNVASIGAVAGEANVGREFESREEDAVQEQQGIFLMEDGKLKPFNRDDYTTSILYEVVEAYTVECRLVRPEDPGTVVYEGRKPSRKTVPICIRKNGECELLSSWEDLETRPELLSDACEVVGATPLKQAFVLRRK